MFFGIQVRVNSQVWSEAKNGERDWGETPFFFSRLTRPFARARLLRYPKPILRKKKKRLFCSLQFKRSLPKMAKDYSCNFR